MTNEFFPYYSGGSLIPPTASTENFQYNQRPVEAIPTDPREVISNWDPTSLANLSSTDIYLGMKIYCLEDKLVHVCIWKPSKGIFNGNDCVWDTISIDSISKTNNWINVEDYNPIDLDSIIKENMLIEWEKEIKSSSTTSYWGYFMLDTDYDSIDEANYWTAERKSILMKQLLSNKMLNSQGEEVSDVSGSYNKLLTKNKTRTIPYNDSSKNFRYMEGANLVLFVPANRSDGSGRTLTVSYYDSTYNEIIFDSKVSRISVDELDFDIYIINHKVELDSDGNTIPQTYPALNQINNGINLKFVAES